MAHSYEVCFAGHCGMSGLDVPCEDMEEVREELAERIRSARKAGQPVSVIKPGEEYELQEPPDCALVPDSAGILYIRDVRKSCPWCGQLHAEDGRFCSDDCTEAYHS
jgi:hypothetical protein